ncbi:AzlC family ABC transporter permease [Xanthobacter agilis]|uniref:4-azaleucine resistance transporter AzlC n=1 Tax=Xanthobacter agilis TaxID=47492 RepID=A0ABU0LJ73_XANAG|nr:AzlC family ABC transporter permease [Xanthobacter agilis]MDQ0507183.1 4-azaleucine resistance transporter AzlC [Xanthobacter agilis]
MPHSDHPPTTLTLAGFFDGARTIFPLMPGLVVFAMAFGAAAAQKGLSLTEAGLFSGLVFAGLAQMVALEGWSTHWTAASLLALGFLTMTVNMRHVLMAAALRPWFAPLPAWQSYSALVLLADNNWALAMRYHTQGGRDAGYFIGAGFITWVIWVIGTLAGHVVGGGIPDPKAVGVDLVVPAFFIAMLLPNWRGRREAVGWGVAATVAIVTSFVLAGWWFIVIGALAGAVAGGFTDER